MEFYFKEHADDSLVTKGIVADGHHIVFEVKNGMAEISDPPNIDPQLTGTAKARATKRRQGAIEAVRDAVRELGGVPLGQAQVEAEATGDTSEEAGAEATGGKSSKGGKK